MKHWTSQQATIHPFVIYFKQENEVEHVSYVVVYDCLEHNTVAVYTFEKTPILSDIHISKTSKQDFFIFQMSLPPNTKIRKTLNFCFHEEDFKVKGECYFVVSEHGKGSCEGIGDLIKRLAPCASVQRPYQTRTPQQLFEWAVENITKVDFACLT
ncbi:hypothetical protein AVEN_72031-1 [Araneus ventricosus]|uniref:Uncharacterized protein n=1 Tax=Araneus ventricosus TaxID=182803 RepID=A0A4Y2UF06_ARAVE|nr:hypothetical protein AVEN_72031-1 [Araneus ventricosus]